MGCRPRAENQCSELSRQSRKNRRGLGRKEEKPCSKTAHGGDSGTNKDKGAQRRVRRRRPGRLCSAQGPLQGPRDLVSGGEEAGMLIQHSRSRVPKPGMELRELPRQREARSWCQI